jgi:hypothetical protein
MYKRLQVSARARRQTKMMMKNTKKNITATATIVLFLDKLIMFEVSLFASKI